jgi:8-oxo-dGTP pyrophosphatase MutT (NUDIX family)
MSLSVTRDLLARALAGPPVFPTPAPWSREHAPASVVVPVRPGEAASVIVVVRSSALADHAGELGFPGGKPHTGETLRAAALRELEEELALPPTAVGVVGELSPIPVVTGKYLITPFVGCLGEGAAPRIASPELAAFLHVPIEPFFDGTASLYGFFTEFRGEPFLLPHFRFDEHVLYGASAVILYELFARLGRELDRALPAPVIEGERPWGSRYPP